MMLKQILVVQMEQVCSLEYMLLHDVSSVTALQGLQYISTAVLTHDKA